MDEYISKQAILKHIEKIRQDALMMDDIRRASRAMRYADICEEVMKNQSADVQPVVRCKYCKHFTKWYNDKRRCFLWCETGIDVFEDGYCTYWEKKYG